MQLQIRDVTADDLPAVLSLNDGAVPHVSQVDIDQMHWFANNVHYFRVAEGVTGDESHIVGFLIGMVPGIDYQSPNYQWFCGNYPAFIYVDRVVVGEAARKTGLGTRFYEDFAAHAPNGTEVMTCEVNIRPSNEPSMQFHRRRGFRQVGSQTTDGGQKEVAFLEKTL
jgi:predicted GNAT superfamily acetyltransferase